MKCLRRGIYYSGYIILLSLSVACQHSNTMLKPTGTLLENQDVENILLELYLIDGQARVRIYNEPVNKIREWLNSEMKNTFKQHNTTYKQFTDSYSYYMANAETSKKMMTNVINRLIKMQAEQVETNRKIDSVTNK
jgi:hypothetical protein